MMIEITSFLNFQYFWHGSLVKVGVERMHKDSKYVLFLDDDVRLHPGSIGALTAEMEKNPEVWLLKPLVTIFNSFLLR